MYSAAVEWKSNFFHRNSPTTRDVLRNRSHPGKFRVTGNVRTGVAPPLTNFPILTVLRNSRSKVLSRSSKTAAEFGSKARARPRVVFAEPFNAVTAVSFVVRRTNALKQLGIRTGRKSAVYTHTLLCDVWEIDSFPESIGLVQKTNRVKKASGALSIRGGENSEEKQLEKMEKKFENDDRPKKFGEI